MAHILLEDNLEYKNRNKVTLLNDYFYDRSYGAWLSVRNNTLMVNDNNFPSITTKKKDIETGEDEKGH